MNSLPINETAPVSAQPGDAQGKSTNQQFDGPLSWSVSDPSLASISPSPDGLSAVLAGLGVGTVTVSASGSVGGNSISGTVVVQVTDVATQILLSVGPASAVAGS